ncbi:MAG: EAL domain-containing protein [Sideroxydans sp.]|nr:EAL domain-containing protein [Sideroxydans sp.]
MSYFLIPILLAGLAISLLLFAVFRNMAKSRTSALDLARRMAADSMESARHYRQLFEEAPLAIGIADAQTGELLDLNRAMERLSGWDKAELVGKPQKILHPAEAGQAAVSSCFAQHLAGADGERIETQLVTKYGELLDVSIKASTLNLDGRKALIGFFSDITERKLYQQSLFKTNELLERIFANLRTLIAYMDADFNFIRVNQAYAAADGHPPDYFVGKNHFQLFPNSENEQIFRDVLERGLPYTVFAKPFVYEHNKERGVTYWDWSLQPVKDTRGHVTGLVLSLLDRTEEMRAEEKLRLYGRALEASDNSIAIVDVTQPQLPLIYVNPAFTSITGYSAEEVLGRNPRFLLGGDREQPEMENIRSALRERRDSHAVLRNYRKDGSQFWNELYVSPVWDDSGEVTHFIGVARDITRRKNYETELERMANFDTLTGLANRNLFQDRLSQAIVHAQRNDGLIALVVLDLDSFKLVNDSLGHHAGDMVLQEVAARLSACVRELDTVARLGGDEFVIAMPELAKIEDAAIVADKLLKTFSEAMLRDMQDLYVTASIGIAVYPQDGEDAEGLLKHAELAMFRAKDRGRNHYQFYAPEMNQRAAESLSLGSDLHRALQHDELTLNYQPQVDLKSGNIVGVEALLRWHHPKLGWVSPAKFIPVAEECGLIIPIGKWVLQQACRAAKAWQDQGLPIVVAVNLSARQIRERGFVQSVRDALLACDLEARYLELELTEGILIEQAEYVFEVLQQLRAMGIVLALDDFGTGYSSLSYLKRFPIGRLKIDQTFVRDIVSDPEDAAIVGAIISMAHDLKLKVIAEGVETKEQLAFLRLRHCDEIQGYYFSKPKPDAEITAMLQQGTQLAPDLNTGEQPAAVLLVEDGGNSQDALAQLLRRDGCHVLRTGSAQDALGMLASHRVGVIVTDQHLPEMSGMELLRRAKQLYPDSMRLVLSGHTDLQAVADAINEGAVYKFLSKSWDHEQLRGQIREAMQSYELKQAHDSLLAQLAATNKELTLAKQLLERKVDQTLLDSLNSLVSLKASQEVLEYLPTGVIGIDIDGKIIVANNKAEEILGATLLGHVAAECLPATLNDLAQQAVRDGSGELRGWRNQQDAEYDCFSHQMNAESETQDVVLVLVAKTAA